MAEFFGCMLLLAIGALLFPFIMAGVYLLMIYIMKYYKFMGSWLRDKLHIDDLIDELTDEDEDL